jgi:hypothetical protein
MAERLAAWGERLIKAALSTTDQRAVALSESVRALVLDRLGADDRDTLHAWGNLGRVLSDAGASPTLIAHAVDALVEVLPDAKGESFCDARAALLEAYVAAQRERAEVRIAEAWRFPRCVVRLGDRTAAVAASFPDDDADAVARWADEVAAGLAKMGVRRVYVEGSAHARAALADALSTFDIALDKVSA